MVGCGRGAALRRGSGQGCRADQDRSRHVAHRSARRQRQDVAGGHAGLGRRHQCQGRAARPAGQARLLRRSEQSVAGPRHLRQAARCRQSRSDRQRLCLDPDRRGDAGRDPAQEAVHQPVRHRHQRAVQLSEIFLDDPERPDAEAGIHARLLQGGRTAEAQAADHRLGLGGRRVRPQRLRGGARERRRRRASRSSTKRAIRHPPSTSRRSCGRSRRPIRICW